MRGFAKLLAAFVLALAPVASTLAALTAASPAYADNYGREGGRREGGRPAPARAAPPAAYRGQPYHSPAYATPAYRGPSYRGPPSYPAPAYAPGPAYGAPPPGYPYPYQPPPPGYAPNSLGAGWAQQQEQARLGVRQGRLLPLGQVIQRVRQGTPGRLLDAGLEPGPDGRPAYRVRWAAAGGRRMDFIVDAVTGAVLARNGY